MNFRRENERLSGLIAAEHARGFVTKMLGSKLGL
jgi:hypothetical protein